MGDVDFFDRDVIRQHKEYCKKYGMERKCDCKSERKNNRDMSTVRSPDLKLPQPNGSAMKAHNGNVLEPIEQLPRSKSTSHLDASEMPRLGSGSSSKEVEPVFGLHLHEKHYCTKTNDKIFCPRHEKGHRLYYSTENLSKSEEKQEKNLKIENQKRKTQRICQQENVSYLKEMPKEDYKTAFKAGIPKSNSSGTCCSFDSGIDCSSNSNSTPCIKATLKVPKPRSPFAKKNYSISTLNPPFSCFKGGDGQGAYADHWRLASVYQHAYKPIEKRKRPLLQTVFQ